jgi:ATP-dependent Clp protease ATP-binding subunit ClpA
MPRLKQALEGAQRLAGELGEGVAGTEHLLAGVIAIQDALATEILAGLGASADTVRAAIATRLGVAPARLQTPPRRRRRLLSKAT